MKTTTHKSVAVQTRNDV